MSSRGGGVSEVVRRLAVELASAGQEMAALGIKDRAVADFSCWRPLMPIELATLGPRPLGYLPALRKELTRFSPEIVHTHGLWKAVSAGVRAWSRRQGRPYVVSPH